MRTARVMVAGVLVVVVLLASSGVVAHGDGALANSRAASAAAANSGTRLYIQRASALYPLDPVTLAPATSMPRIFVGGSHRTPPFVVATPDGRVIASLTYRQGLFARQRAQDQLVRVIDGHTGAIRARFHPPVPMDLENISPDGTRLFGIELPFDSPYARWAEVDAVDGRLVGRLSFRQDCCENDTMIDTAAQRLYALHASHGCRASVQLCPVALSAYSLLTGSEIGAVKLPGVKAYVLTGSTPSFRDPGAALSPDGKEVVALDGTSRRFVLVDTSTLHIIQQGTISSDGLSNLAGEIVFLQFMPDGQHVLEFGVHATTSAGVRPSDGDGVRLIDAARGQVLAHVLGDRLADPQPAPDGSAVYTFSPGHRETEKNPTGCPCVLRRLDPNSLHTLAKRRVSADGLQVLIVAGGSTSGTFASPR